MNPSSPIKARNVSKNLDFLWKTSQINSVCGEGGRSVIFGQDSTVSESVSLWGLSTGPHKKRGRGSRESSSRNKGCSGKKWGQRGMHDEEREKEKGKWQSCPIGREGASSVLIVDHYFWVYEHMQENNEFSLKKEYP